MRPAPPARQRISLLGRGRPTQDRAGGDATKGDDARPLVADRPGHDRRYAINGTKAREDLDFAADRDFSQGLRETLAWYREHELWWRALPD